MTTSNNMHSPSTYHCSVLAMMSVILTSLMGCKPARQDNTPEFSLLSPEQIKAYAYSKECQEMSLASVKKNGMEDLIEYSQDFTPFEYTQEYINKHIKPYLPQTYHYKQGIHPVKTYWMNHQGVREPAPRNSQYIHAWVGPSHFKFLPYSGIGNPFYFGEVAWFGFNLPEVFDTLGVPEKSDDIAYYKELIPGPDSQYVKRSQLSEKDLNNTGPNKHYGGYITDDFVKIEVSCNTNPDIRMHPASWRMKINKPTTVEDVIRHLSTHYSIGPSLEWMHTRSLSDLGLEEYRAGRAEDAKILLMKNKNGPESQEVLSKFHEESFYLPSDNSIQKADVEISVIFCMSYNQCDMSYTTPDGLLVSALFSRSQLQFWQEIAKFTPQYINSITEHE